MYRTLLTVAGAMLMASCTNAAELKSGPQIGGSPSAFNPLHATGPDEGKKTCLV